MIVLQSLVILLLLASGDAQITTVNVEHNCITEPECSQMKLVYSNEQGRWESNALELQFSRVFGDESCMFYINKKHEPITFLSTCETTAGFLKYEGVIINPGVHIHIMYNEQDKRHELLQNENPGDPDQRSLSDSLPAAESFCEIVPFDPSSDLVLTIQNRAFVPTSDSAVLEIAFSVDQLFVKHFGSYDRAEKMMYQIKNGMSAMYQELDIHIRVVDMYVFDQPLTSSLLSGIEETKSYLKRIREHYMEHIYPETAAGRTGVPDVVMTFTARPFEAGHLLGVGLEDSLCTDQAHAVILMPAEYQEPERKVQLLMLMATTASHELGHILGVLHQDNCSSCHTPEGQCFMTSVVTHYTGLWSDCTKAHISKITQHPSDYQKACMFVNDAEVTAAVLSTQRPPVTRKRQTTTTSITAVSRGEKTKDSVTKGQAQAGWSDYKKRMVLIIVLVVGLVIAVTCLVAAVGVALCARSRKRASRNQHPSLSLTDSHAASGKKRMRK